VSALTAVDVATGYRKQEVVRGISVTAEQGEITCIFGPNGSGNRRS